MTEYNTLNAHIGEHSLAGYDPLNLVATKHSPINAPNQVDEKPQDTVDRIAAETRKLKDEIKFLGGQTDGLPDIAAITVGDISAIRDAYAQRKHEAAEKAAEVAQSKGMEILLGASGVTGASSLLAAADKGAANSMMPQQELAKKRQDDPNNKEFAQAMEKSGVTPEQLANDKVQGGHKVDMSLSGLLAYNPNTPNLVAARQQELESGQKQSGRERSLVG